MKLKLEAVTSPPFAPLPLCRQITIAPLTGLLARIRPSFLTVHHHLPTSQLPATFLMAHPWLIPWRVLTSTKCLVQLETKLAWRQGDGQGQGQGRRVCRKGGQTEAWLLATAQWGHNFRARQLASGARGSEREPGQQTECETELESESETGRLSTMPH